MIGRPTVRRRRARNLTGSAGALTALTVLILLPVLAVGPLSAAAASGTGASMRVAPDVISALQTGDRTPVIVRYRDTAPSPAPTGAGDGLRRSALRSSGDRVLAALAPDSYGDVHRVDNWPMVAIDADRDAIAATGRLAGGRDRLGQPPPRGRPQPIGARDRWSDRVRRRRHRRRSDGGHRRHRRRRQPSLPRRAGRGPGLLLEQRRWQRLRSVRAPDPTVATGPGSAAPCPIADCIPRHPRRRHRRRRQRHLQRRGQGCHHHRRPDLLQVRRRQRVRRPAPVRHVPRLRPRPRPRLRVRPAIHATTSPRPT